MQVDRLQDQLAQARASSGDVAGGRSPLRGPVDPPGSLEGDGMLQKMMTRLEAMEKTIREDAGRQAPAPAPKAAAVALDGANGAAPAASASPPAQENVRDVIARLQRATRPPHEAFLEQLSKYREIPSHEWPMPPGYQKRLAPSYLAEVYRSGTAVSYAKNWLREHSLANNVPAQEMISIMEAVDDSILMDQRDVINSLAFEKLIRRAYGLERAFEDCWKESDWKRPDGKKTWTTRVKWELCSRYDTRALNMRSARVAAADEEAKQAMERDAAFFKWYSKSTEASAAKAGPET